MYPPPDRPVRIAVIGERQTSSPLEEAAETIGREIARRGGVLICGGMGGVMEAACRGAKAVDGLTVGILPGLDRGEANRFVDVAIPTGLGEARNALVARSADAVVAVGGEWGTLSEIALALKAGTPVVGLKTWELSKIGRPVEGIERAEGPAEAVDRALSMASAGKAKA